MIERLHELATSVGEMENTADVHLFESVEKGMVDELTVAGILQGPADMWAVSFDLEVRIFPGGDTLIEGL